MKGIRVKDILGGKFDIKHCKGAIKTYQSALNSVHSSKQRKFDIKIRAVLDRLAQGKRLSRDHAPKMPNDLIEKNDRFPKEGKLPKLKGQQSTDFFYAVKELPIRGYFWLSPRVTNTYFVSHYIKKDFNDLSKEDIQKVGNNWRRIEVNNDES